MAKLNDKQKAQTTALQGDIDTAVTLLEALIAGGHLAAHVSLTEIAAYRGAWPEVMRRVELLMATPDAMVTQNVYEDMAMLLARAGAELGRWPDVLRIGKAARGKLSRRANDELRLATIRTLTRIAESGGEGTFIAGDDPPQVRKAHFEAALEKAKARKFATPTKRVHYLYSLALCFGQEDAALELFDRETVPPSGFDDAVFVVAALANSGRADDAWQALRSYLPLWWPVDVSQVLPVVLLVHKAIMPLMSPPHCAEVMRTPRGPMAAAA